MSDEFTVSIQGHSLTFTYATRDGRVFYDLSERVPLVPRPERDVLIALLRWAMEELEKGPIP